MNLRKLAVVLAIAATGTAFAATTTETTVTRDTPNGTVTRHIVKVKPNGHRFVKRTVVHRAPVRHARHARHASNPHRIAHRKVVVLRNS